MGVATREIVMRGTWSRGALALLVLTAWAVPGVDQARADWGAIAVSEAVKDPGWGYSHKYRSQDGAKRRALAECRKRAGNSACEVKLTFNDSCGAVGYAEITWKGEDGKTKRLLQMQRSVAPTAAVARTAFDQLCERFRDKYSSLGEFECEPLAVVCSSRGLVKP